MPLEEMCHHLATFPFNELKYHIALILQIFTVNGRTIKLKSVNYMKIYYIYISPQYQMGNGAFVKLKSINF